MLIALITMVNVYLQVADSVFPQKEEGNDISYTDPISVFVGSVDRIENHNNRIYADVKLNNGHKITMKVDTAEHTRIITTNDLQELPFPITIDKSDSILKIYGGSPIQNLGVTTLKFTVNNKSINTQFIIVKAFYNWLQTISRFRQSETFPWREIPYTTRR